MPPPSKGDKTGQRAIGRPQRQRNAGGQHRKGKQRQVGQREQSLLYGGERVMVQVGVIGIEGGQRAAEAGVIGERAARDTQADHGALQQLRGAANGKGDPGSREGEIAI